METKSFDELNREFWAVCEPSALRPGNNVVPALQGFVQAIDLMRAQQGVDIGRYQQPSQPRSFNVPQQQQLQNYSPNFCMGSQFQGYRGY